MPNTANLPIISPALQDWLANCESLVEMVKNFQADGGHMQFNFDLLDPEKLPEPLSSEAIAYCERAVE
jgi:hypothetical protein